MFSQPRENPVLFQIIPKQIFESRIEEEILFFKKAIVAELAGFMRGMSWGQECREVSGGGHEAGLAEQCGHWGRGRVLRVLIQKELST